MGHVFVKPSLVVDTAIKILQREIVLPSLVWTNGLGDFGGSSSDTLTIRIPAIATANTRDLRAVDRTVTTNDLVEYSVPVTLSEHIYAALKFTDEQRTLDIRDYTQQVLMPQVMSVAYKLEDRVATLIEGAPYTETNYITATDTVPAFIDADRRLNEANVPRAGRVLVVGSAVAATLLKDTQFRNSDKSGDVGMPNQALREAKIGRLAGYDVIQSNAIAADKAYMWHQTAFVLATRAPVVPEGAAAGSSLASNGLALRWLADYDYASLGDRTLVDVFTGYASITDPNGVGFVRAQELHLGVTGITIVGGSFGGVTAAAGANHTAQLKVRDSNGVDVTSLCTYASATEAKATVSSSGLVTGVAAGTSVLTATYSPPQGGADVTATATVTVV